MEDYCEECYEQCDRAYRYGLITEDEKYECRDDCYWEACYEG